MGVYNNSMGLAQKLMSHHHHHDDASGGVITHARGYELFAGAFFLGRRARIWDRLVVLSGACPGDRVLDIGCGTGYFAIRIARAIEPGGSVVGIDPSQPMLDYAAAHAPSNCTFQAAGAEDLPFADASFDVVVSSLAFHHFPTDSRREAVHEMFRVLRPGGRVFIADFHPPSGRLLNRLVAAVSAHAMAHDNSEDIEALVRESGFSAIRRGRTGMLHYVQAERPSA